MVNRNTNESLHSYLRRHYEKISEQRAKQFAKQEEVELDLIYESRPAEVSGC